VRAIVERKGLMAMMMVMVMVMMMAMMMMAMAMERRRRDVCGRSCGRTSGPVGRRATAGPVLAG
jgi:hypothetical protein